MNKFTGARLFFHIHAIDQNKGVMIGGVDLADIILDTDFCRDYLDIIGFLKAGAYVNTNPVILPQKIPDTDEKNLPVFACKQVSKLVRHL
jgi:hypothetical protein